MAQERFERYEKKYRISLDQYQELMSPFPLVKDIVGYLKMCHSILPIKR